MELRVSTFAAHAVGGEGVDPVDAAGLPLWPPRVRGAGWRTRDGLGTVRATVTVRAPGEDPHNLSVVDLDEGLRVMSRIVGLAPESVCVGMRVRLAWDGEVPVFVGALPGAAKAA